MNLANLVISQWLFLRYVSADSGLSSAADSTADGAGLVLVPAALFGTIFMLGRITDAITDPLIGYWSDHSRSRRGRRLPFIVLGTVPLALFFFMLWVPPAAMPVWFNALYVFVFIQLYFIFYTVVVTPYLALLPELSADIHERLNISTLQAVFVMLGTMVFGAMGLLLQKWGWSAVGGVVALLIVLSYLPTMLMIREDRSADSAKARKQQDAREGLASWLKSTLSNKPFVFLVAATSLYWFGLNLVLMIAPYWVVQILHLKQDAVSLLMAPFLLSSVVFFWVFNVLAKKYGKYLMFMLTLAGTALLVPLLALVPHFPVGSVTAQSMFVMALVGMPVAGFFMLPYALLADVVDFDEKSSGQRREAIFFGVQAIFQKSAIGLSILVFGFMAETNLQADGGSLKRIAIIAALASLTALGAFYFYPLRDR